MEELIKQLSDYLEDVELPLFINNGNTFRYWLYSPNTRKEFGKVTKIIDAKKIPSIYSHEDITTRICYGSFLSTFHSNFAVKGDAVFISYINKEPNTSVNFTWLTRDQLFKHIDYCRQRFSLNFDFTLRTTKRRYIVVFDFKQLTHFQVKFILFWTRYAWEYPSNLALFDAMLLHKMLPNEEPLNLLTMTSGALSDSGLILNDGEYRIYSDQCLCSVVSRFVDVDKDIVGVLKERAQGDVVKLFTPIRNSLPNIKGRKIAMRNVSTNRTEIQKWVDPENIDRRIHLYIDDLLPVVTK